MSFRDGHIDCNFLGVAFINDDISIKKAEKVNEFMNELLEKYKSIIQEEFDKYLNKLGLESYMGAVIKKQKKQITV